MKITESAIRNIVKEEAKKFKSSKALNESRQNAESVLEGAMDEYVDQMISAGLSYEMIANSLRKFTNDYCDSMENELGNDY
jgi:hypothetical protein